MQAAWYEQQGEAKDVLVVGDMEDPLPGPGEVRVRILASGINPGDIKKRANQFGVGLPYPRIIPHSDGAGIIDCVGTEISKEWLNRRVWCYGAQSYRPFGTAAEMTVLPLANIVPLPNGVPFEVGACLGIPGITAFRAVDVRNSIHGKTVLVQGAAGSVGSWAVKLAHQAKARVIGVVRSDRDVALASQAGAEKVVLAGEGLFERIQALAPQGIDHIIDVDFAANITIDSQILAQGGSIAAYATSVQEPTFPFWPLAFMNAQLYFLGSDDFPVEEKIKATQAINQALESDWSGPPIAQRFSLEEIAKAHDAVANPSTRGRVVIVMER